jgi:hypothetical protein
LLRFIQEELLDKIITWPSPAECQEIQNMYFELEVPRCCWYDRR